MREDRSLIAPRDAGAVDRLAVDADAESAHSIRRMSLVADGGRRGATGATMPDGVRRWGAVSVALVACGAGACVSTGTALEDRELPRFLDSADVVVRELPEPAPDRVVAAGDVDGDGMEDLVAYATAGRT